MTGIIVVKIGGVAGTNLSEAFFQQISQWQKAGKQIVIVHGGGQYISALMTQLNLPVTVKNGLRVTTEKGLEVAKMAMLGQVQPLINQRFQEAGFQAIGLNTADNQLIQGEFLDKEVFGHVGTVEKIKTDTLHMLLEQGYIPVIAPLGLTKKGEWLNINADDTACKIAEALKAEALYLLTDVPGIKKEQEWLNYVDTNEAEALVTQEVVTGGMQPKIYSCITALKNGVKKVKITDELQHQGTTIHLAEGTL